MHEETLDSCLIPRASLAHTMMKAMVRKVYIKVESEHIRTVGEGNNTSNERKCAIKNTWGIEENPCLFQCLETMLQYIMLSMLSYLLLLSFSQVLGSV